MELKKQNNNVIWALVTLVVIIAAVAVAGMLLLGHDDESIQGQMEASEYRVSSKVPGRILHFYVKEGDHVRARGYAGRIGGSGCGCQTVAGRSSRSGSSGD